MSFFLVLVRIPVVNDTILHINLIAVQGTCLIEVRRGRKQRSSLFGGENGVSNKFFLFLNSVNRNAIPQLHNPTGVSSAYYHSMCNFGRN